MSTAIVIVVGLAVIVLCQYDMEFGGVDRHARRMRELLRRQREEEIA